MKWYCFAIDSLEQFLWNEVIGEKVSVEQAFSGMDTLWNRVSVEWVLSAMETLWKRLCRMGNLRKNTLWNEVIVEHAH